MAEMTGRKGRVIADKRGRGVYTLRANPDSQEMDSLNVLETCEHWLNSQAPVVALLHSIDAILAWHAESFSYPKQTTANKKKKQKKKDSKQKTKVYVQDY